MIEVTVPYKVYKERCEGKYKKVPDSYDSHSKTIKVYMTAAQKEDFEKRMQEEEAKWQEVEMPYKEWQKKYSKYKKHGYNDRKGTVIVTLPSSIEYKRTTDEHYEERHAFRAGYTNELTIIPDKIDVDNITVEIPEELIND